MTSYWGFSRSTQSSWNGGLAMISKRYEACLSSDLGLFTDKTRLFRPMITCQCLFKPWKNTTRCSMWAGIVPRSHAGNKCKFLIQTQQHLEFRLIDCSGSLASCHSQGCTRYAASTSGISWTSSTSSQMTTSPIRMWLMKLWRTWVHPHLARKELGSWLSQIK